MAAPCFLVEIPFCTRIPFYHLDGTHFVIQMYTFCITNTILYHFAFYLSFLPTAQCLFITIDPPNVGTWKDKCHCCIEDFITFYNPHTRINISATFIHSAGHLRHLSRHSCRHLDGLFIPFVFICFGQHFSVPRRVFDAKIFFIALLLKSEEKSHIAL